MFNRSKILFIAVICLALGLFLFIIYATEKPKVNEVPQQFRDEYNQSCIKEGGNKEYCDCTLNELLKVKTLEEIIALGVEYENTEKVPQEIMTVSQICAYRQK